MANVYATKSGDWSDTTVWNTGVLPTSADDVYANNFNVNVNQNITVNSLRNTANTGITAGGTFSFNTGGVTANISENIFFLSSAIFILVNASSGNITLNIPIGIINADQSTIINYTGNCNFTLTALRLSSGTALYNSRNVLTKTSLGILTINAELIAGSSANGNVATIFLQSNSITYINGNLIGGTGNNAQGCVINQTAGNLNINGNVIGGFGALGIYGTIYFNSSGALNIVGNVQGNVSKAIYATSGTINIVGTIIGSNSIGIPAVDINGAASLNHVGTAQASASASAITCNTPTTSVITCTGPFLKNGYIVAVASQTLRINFNSNSYFQFKKSNGDDIDYVSTIEGYNYPATSDVRYGVSYKSGLAIGTCHVPTPDNVRKNIPVDNTVGTADNITADDILQAIQDSSLPIAERLRNVSTVESTGAQFAGYG